MITQDDAERSIHGTLVKTVDFHSELVSTNDRALQLARQEGLAHPILVWALHQTAGRGRGTNPWWSAPGALTFSLLLDSQLAQLPQRCWPQVSLTAGLAVAEALSPFLTYQSIQLKWPNDVYAEGQKLCGILIEAPADRAGQLAIGIGINVNNSLQGAPIELRQAATAMCDLAGRPFSLVEVLHRVLVQLTHYIDLVGRNDVHLSTRWRQRCLLTNRRVCIEVGSRRIEGLCRGIDQDGALMIQTSTGSERCFAGVVAQF
jgi:BirA family biotin operon repressor/biotin-[acetyl-CoA-carboxylase] ligase